MTRIARGDPRMGAAIAATNAEAIASRLRDLRDVVVALRAEFATDTPGATGR